MFLCFVLLDTSGYIEASGCTIPTCFEAQTSSMCQSPAFQVYMPLYLRELVTDGGFDTKCSQIPLK